jgi:hypothetical protein
MNRSGKTMPFLTDKIETQGLSGSHGPLVEDGPENINKKRNAEGRGKRQDQKHDKSCPPRQKDRTDDPEEER